ncbi:MAG: sigma-54 dependent transcriptional regulator [Anaeromyxobacteraceae bacterium]
MAVRPRVLVVDDKENLRNLLVRVLGETCEVTAAEDGARALALLASAEFDVVLTDLRMPGADGFDVLRAAAARPAAPEVVMMTAYATVGDAVRAMKLGAYDYLEKPFDPDDAALVVARAAERRRSREPAASTAPSPGSAPVGPPGGLVGDGPELREVHRLLAQAAAADLTVLLTGETGTGKELAARAIHQGSARQARRFVPVNCGALPAELVESELFGHARGAFTGAAGPRPGLFEEADGGTLFLDEIGDLPLPVQVKLNRALQEKEIRRVGDNRATTVDVRVVAATHRDLQAEVAAGRFREDLYYRLAVFPVRLPPLRERTGDVPALAAHLLAKHARAHRKALDGLEPDALRALEAQPWPGNVRQLENAIERAVAVAGGRTVTLADLGPELRAPPTTTPATPAPAETRLPYKEAVENARERASKEYLAAILREHDGNVTRAAEAAGMERESLHRLMKRYGLRAEEFRRR